MTAPPLAIAVVTKERHLVHLADDRNSLQTSLDEWWVPTMAGILATIREGFPSSASPLAMAIVAKEMCPMHPADDMAAVCLADDRTALQTSLGEWHR